MGLKINFIIRHGTTKSSSKKDFLHRIIYHKVNYHIAISKHLANNVKKIIPFGKNTQLKVIYSSLRNAPYNIPKSKVCSGPSISLLHVSRITEGKGQIDAIKACEALYQMKKDFSLHLVGEMDPDYQQKFTDYLNSVPYKNSIKIEGFSANVAQFYIESDIFIFPSKGEGLGNSFIEALSYGLTCIAYNNTTFPEFKELGFDLFLAEDQSVESLKSTLLTAIDFCENNKVTITKNIQLAEELFSSKKEKREILELLR